MSTQPDLHPALAAEPITTAHLLGGPHDGDEWTVPAHCHRIDLPDDTSYTFCPHASALHGRDTFRHSTLDPFLCAR